MTADLLWLPGLVWVSVLLLYAGVPRGVVDPLSRPGAMLVVVASTVAVFAPQADLAYLATALGTSVLAFTAWPVTRVGSVTLWTGALLSAGAGLAFRVSGNAELPLYLSLGALALRCGVVPVHAGVTALSQRAPALQSRQFATLLVLVFVHLRFADHVDLARSIAPTLVGLGAASALLFGLTSLVRPSLTGLLQGSTLMHGGLLFAAVGAAGRGHHAAALFACLTMALAVGGLSQMVLALEARVGTVGLGQRHGWGRAFPRLTAAFAFLGACGVGMPGTAGFIADDLLLHALWEESVVATVAVALASALLAIATLRAVAAVVFGKQSSSVAPDLLPAERWSAVAHVVLLVVFGLLPNILTAKAPILFGGP
jgi:NADH-quinone oxidoreductase subunit M